jgi:cardiolipin synthase
METDVSKKIWTIPNILSLVRLAMIPLIVWLYTVKEDLVLTAVFLVLSGLTDLVDGYIARNYHQVSDLGKALDPVADKLTQLAMLFCLISKFPAMLIPFIILAVKEFITGIMGLIVIHKTDEVKGAVWHGKACTVLLYGMMFCHLVWVKIPALVSNVMIGTCVVMMLLSFVLYGTRNIVALINARNKEEA